MSHDPRGYGNTSDTGYDDDDTESSGGGKEFVESYTDIGIFRSTKAWSASRVYLHCGTSF